MSLYSQLTHLILSFYREDLSELEQLQPLKTCKLSRRWGVLRIDCRDRQCAEALVRAAALLEEPVAQLRLAQRINILVRGSLVTALPVDTTKLNT